MVSCEKGEREGGGEEGIWVLKINMPHPSMPQQLPIPAPSQGTYVPYPCAPLPASPLPLPSSPPCAPASPLCRYLLRRSLLEYENQALETLIVRPSDDPNLARLVGMRHTILARPSGSDVVAEMWERGLEHAGRLGERHGHAFVQRPMVAAAAAGVAGQHGILVGGRSAGAVIGVAMAGPQDLYIGGAVRAAGLAALPGLPGLIDSRTSC